MKNNFKKIVVLIVVVSALVGSMVIFAADESPGPKDAVLIQNHHLNYL